MNKLFIILVIVSSVVAYVSATCLVCPQAIPDDTSPAFCASNAYGNSMVTLSQFTNWNCNHPANQYTKVSDAPCPPGPDTLATCGQNICPPGGTPICAQLNNPSGGLGYTTSVFPSQCQLNYYNCRNPNRQYVKNLLAGTSLACRSVGF